jgi:hypothetical protein
MKIMPRKVILVEFPELLSYAQEIGIDWGTANDVLVKDKICPMYEQNSCEYYFSDHAREEDSYGYSDATVRILVGFMIKHDLDWFTLIND